MGLLDLLSGLFNFVLLFADILLWPEQAVDRHLRHEAAHHSKSRSRGEILHRVFIALTIIALCLLLFWI